MLVCEAAEEFAIPHTAIRRQMEKEYQISLADVDSENEWDEPSYQDFSEVNARFPGTDALVICEFSRFTSVDFPPMGPKSQSSIRR